MAVSRVNSGNGGRAKETGVSSLETFVFAVKSFTVNSCSLHGTRRVYRTVCFRAFVHRNALAIPRSGTN